MDTRTNVERTNKFVCTRIKLKQQLEEAWERCVGVVPNKWNPKLYAWVFNRTPTLTKVVDEYVKNLNSL